MSTLTTLKCDMGTGLHSPFKPSIFTIRAIYAMIGLNL